MDYRGLYNNKKIKAASAVAVVLVILIVITGFQLLKQQEDRVAHARDTGQEEAAAGSGITDKGTEEWTDSSKMTQKEEALEDENTEKLANKYNRTRKLPYTDCVKYTKEDLEDLDQYGLRITRNEIFAHHGRMFNDVDLQKYFDSQSWYQAKTPPSEFDDSCLNEVELYNVDLILKCEQERGGQ